MTLFNKPQLLKSAQRKAALFLADYCSITERPYSVIGPKHGLSIYIAHLVVQFEHNRTSINTIVNRLAKYRHSDAPLITLEQIKEILELVEHIGAKKILAYNLREQPLVITIVPYQHDLNSLYVPALHIIQCNKVGEGADNNPEYVFLHELGHALQTCLTGSDKKFPISFVPVFELVFNNKVENVEPGDTLEVFADSFSIAAVYGTKYHSSNPFYEKFHMIHQAILAIYFKMICESPTEADNETFWTKTKKDYFNDAVKQAEHIIIDQLEN